MAFNWRIFNGKTPYLCLPKTCHLLIAAPFNRTVGCCNPRGILGPKNWRLPNTGLIDPGDMELAYPDILDSVKRGRGSPQQKCWTFRMSFWKAQAAKEICETPKCEQNHHLSYNLSEVLVLGLNRIASVDYNNPSSTPVRVFKCPLPKRTAPSISHRWSCQTFVKNSANFLRNQSSILRTLLQSRICTLYFDSKVGPHWVTTALHSGWAMKPIPREKVVEIMVHVKHRINAPHFSG